MDSKSSATSDISDPHSLTDHPGIVGVEPLAGGGALAIDYDPEKLSESDLRSVVRAHVSPVPMAGPSRMVLHLDGKACEAAALKLEKRVTKVPGVRRARATYIGQVLCLTFDTTVSSEPEILHRLRGVGAKVSELPIGKPAVQRSWLAELASGKWNEELSCGLGFLFLVTAALGDHFTNDMGWPWIFYVLAYVFCGQAGVRSAWASLREKTIDIDFLMILAAAGAAMVGAWFEGALLLFLFSFSNVLQNYAMDRTRKAIESLMSLRPDTARVKRDGVWVTVPSQSLSPGDLILLRPGELLPADGIIRMGISSLDESMLTGEAVPVDKSPGSPVFAGTLNQNGSLEVEVSKSAGDSTLARMVRMVAEARSEKSHTQRFMESAEQYYAAGVIVFTVLVLLVPWLLWKEDFASSFYRAMTVMVVASPCALVISTPATVLSAIGGAARKGLLIKGGSHLATAAGIDIVCFDKTGTLTRGKPALKEVVLADGSLSVVDGGPLSSQAVNTLQLVASIENQSEHPLARAVVDKALGLGLTLEEGVRFQALPGKGALAEWNQRQFLLGSRKFVESLGGSASPEMLATIETLPKGRTWIWFGETRSDRTDVLACLAISDSLREEAGQTVTELHAMGIRKVVMLTGDREEVAAEIAAKIGLDEFHAGLLPEDKVRRIQLLKEEGSVLMVGDGVNDAPALASAHLGMAMGAAGTDIAMETADVVLMGDRLERIPALLQVARRAKHVLTQNLVFAGLVIVFLVAGALGFNLPLPLGVAGHEGSTVLVCLNGLRLLGFPSKRKMP